MIGSRAVTKWVCGAFAGLLLAQAAATAGAASLEQAFIVTFDGALPDGLAEGGRWAGERVDRADPALGFAVVKTSRTMADALARLPGVKAVEEDEILTIQLSPNDARYKDMYGPAQVRAPEAWDLTIGTVASSVCIVDTGVRYTHEDLAGARWLGGHDFVNNDRDPMDDQGHGTHVAGTAAATIANGKGIAGIAQVGVYGVKVLDAKGSGSTSNVALGIRWCADHGAKVISLSLGGGGSSTLRSAVSYAWNKGALVVAAAGNSGPCKECILYPAAYPEALAVTCTTQSRGLCSFSSTGSVASLAAPGYGILSLGHTSNSAYKTSSGTSMSTPHVSGVAALVWSHVPTLTNAELKKLLTENAHDLGPAGRDVSFGFGLVDAKATLDAALRNGPAPVPGPGPAPEPTPEPAPEPAPNRAPVADAGPDQTLRDNRGRGLVYARLDGRASHDPDGTIVRYTWREGGRLLSSGPAPSLSLGVGTHTIELTVTDNRGASASDTVVVTVHANQAPIADFEASCDGFTCRFDASASKDLDGRVLSLRWAFGDGLSGTGALTEHRYRKAGTYEVVLTVMDDGLARTVAKKTVQVG